MGAECPNGHGRQNVVVNITADGSTPQRASDVIAVKLKCGCVVGGEEYRRFQEAVQKVKQEEAEAMAKVRKTTQDKLGNAYRLYVVQGGAKHGTE